MKKSNKAQFNFVWLFAVFAGTTILILAIYGATKFSDTQRLETSAKTSKEISILTDPMQAGISEQEVGEIYFTQETRIDNSCNDFELGKNLISTSIRTNKREEFKRVTIQVPVTNKYIFSSKEESGKSFTVISRPFNFPYEISDILILVPSWKNYCFTGSDIELKKDLETLSRNIPSFEVDNCTKQDSIKVCFSSSQDCDIRVNGNSNFGVVRKEGEELVYSGNLLYAAIFSDKSLYDCNVKRLLYRSSLISQELSQKADLLNLRNCNTNLKPDLLRWQSLTINSSEITQSLVSSSDNLNRKNNNELCGLWS